MKPTPAPTNAPSRTATAIMETSGGIRFFEPSAEASPKAMAAAKPPVQPQPKRYRR